MYKEYVDSIEYISLVVASKKGDEDYLSKIDYYVKRSIKSCLEKGISNHIIYRKYIDILNDYPMSLIDKIHIKNLCMILTSEWQTSDLYYEIDKGLLSKLIKNDFDKAMKLIEILLRYKKKDSKRKEIIIDRIEAYLPSYQLSKLTNTIRKDLNKSNYDEMISFLISIINDMEREKGTKINAIWLPTIEEHEQSKHSDDFEMQIIRLLRDLLEHDEPELIRKKIIEMFKTKGSVLRRVAIHIINFFYEYFSDIFWSQTGNPLESTFDVHETFVLLENHSKELKEYQLDKVISWIETKSYKWIEDDLSTLEINKKRIAYAKKRWYLAIIESGYAPVLRLYKEYDALNETKYEHPSLLTYSSSLEPDYIAKNSPITEEQMLLMNTEQILNELGKKLPEESFDGPSKESLAWVLRECVIKDPEKFTSNIKKYVEIDGYYIGAIFGGFYEAAIKSKVLDWGIIFEYYNEINRSIKFLQFKGRDRIKNTIVDLIIRGSRNDSYGFEVELIRDALGIIMTEFNKTHAVIYKIIKDEYFKLYQDEQHNLYEAMINLSLKDKRNSNREWIPSVKNKFEQNIMLKNSPVVFFVIGEFLSNFLFLDKNWIIENFSIIFNKHEIVNWSGAMTGFLSTSQANKEIYKMFKQNGDIRKTLEVEFDQHVDEKKVQHIVVAYMNDVEDFDDSNSSINYLFELGNRRHLLEVIRFINRVEWSEVDQTKKVEEILKKLYEYYGNNKKYDEIFSESILLFQYVMNIKKFEKYILECVECIEYGRNYVVKELIDFCESNYKSSPDLVIEIFDLIAIKKLTYSGKQDEKLQEIIDELYKTGNYTKELNKVCNDFIHNNRSSYKNVCLKYEK